MNQSKNLIPIACVRVEDAISPEVKNRHREIWGIVERSALGIDELEAGYAIRFRFEDTLFLSLAELVTYERLCCPFLHFGLELKPDDEEVNLRLTGGDGVKEYLSMELAPLMTPNKSLGRSVEA